MLLWKNPCPSNYDYFTVFFTVMNNDDKTHSVMLR